MHMTDSPRHFRIFTNVTSLLAGQRICSFYHFLTLSLPQLALRVFSHNGHELVPLVNTITPAPQGLPERPFHATSSDILR
jgi:hypothetical protein